MDLGRIPAECIDVLLDPRNGRELVPKPEIHCAQLPRFCSLGEPEWPDAIVNADVDYRGPLDRTFSPSSSATGLEKLTL